MALFDHCGIVRAQTMEELFDVVEALDHQPVPKGNRVAILTNAGGPGILATDAAAQLGLDITSRLRDGGDAEVLPAAGEGRHRATRVDISPRPLMRATARRFVRSLPIPTWTWSCYLCAADLQ